ncbi:hypothetical protein CH373_14325 [Leptospira perolatii]|uniref:FMN dependent NADH:quinone oxidoreductase n=1 Tax=Leptospira perolatii TaxID=2023191 RepID=A0A2M9ZK31_9LEPT|nr:NAD(P)H-dependent oxidoreductase [Leptospira perolatii]PJZ69284.1 hypothetical protein CH360_12295 [Leptospira perolatii]PJZ72334.1 hypothetical protein CH373_14325 [Leptospira perolatii]
MSHLLRIDASARLEGSVSRELADAFEEKWKAAHPRGKISYRDLVAYPIPHLSEMTIQGFYAPPPLNGKLSSATAISDQLIEELRSVDTVLISTPMYNFTVPSVLKAYIDQIVRIGKSFSMTDHSFQGLLTGKRAFVITASGAVFSDSKMEEKNHLDSYLSLIFGFIGFDHVEIARVEGTATSPSAFQESRTRAIKSMDGFLLKDKKLEKAASFV